MSNVKELLLDTDNTCWAKFRDSQFEVLIYLISPKEKRELARKFGEWKFNSKTHQRDYDYDAPAYLRAQAIHCVRNWRGLTGKLLHEWQPLTFKEDTHEEDIPFTKENVELLLDKLHRFDDFINSVIDQTFVIREETQKEEIKNLQTTSVKN